MGRRALSRGQESAFSWRQTLSELASPYLVVHQAFQFRHSL